jgi:hypothetical protein
VSLVEASVRVRAVERHLRMAPECGMVGGWDGGARALVRERVRPATGPSACFCLEYMVSMRDLWRGEYVPMSRAFGRRAILLAVLGDVKCTYELLRVGATE